MKFDSERVKDMKFDSERVKDMILDYLKELNLKS